MPLAVEQKGLALAKTAQRKERKSVGVVGLSADQPLDKVCKKKRGE